MTGQALIVQGDALRLPLPDESVDLVVTSPPYFALRAYSAGDGEIGSEPTPQAYLEALWAATAEMVRVLQPTGSLFIDLGDKYVADNRGSGVDVKRGEAKFAPAGPQGYVGREFARQKSLLLLPERYRVGCVDRLGLIARAVIVWGKPNGLPESVTDRVRRSHEDWVHLVKQPRYYAATDEIRENYSDSTMTRAHLARTVSPNDGLRKERELGGRGGWSREAHGAIASESYANNPLGKLPGSVWTIPSEPLNLPGYFILQDGTLQDFLAPSRGRPRPRTNSNGHGLFDLDPFAELVGGEDAGAWRWLRATGVNASPWPQQDAGLQLRTAASHYAAFPSRWPEQLIKGFSPPGICLDCGQGRVPVVERQAGPDRPNRVQGRNGDATRHGQDGRDGDRRAESARILGYTCPCVDQGGDALDGPDRSSTRPLMTKRGGLPPTRPAVILDPFSGTGTTPMVARALGRIGIGVDLSMPYCRAACWRVHHQANKAISRTWTERQGQLL